MNAAAYRLVIETARASSSFEYEANLYHDGRRIGTTFTYTRWGARMWARKTARRHKDRQEWRGEVHFDV